jgi:hypothetical protein
MTDHPRFQIASGCSDQCFRQYHGAALVAWVFKATDWWLSRRPRAGLAVCASASQSVIGSTIYRLWRMGHDAP